MLGRLINILVRDGATVAARHSQPLSEDYKEDDSDYYRPTGRVSRNNSPDVMVDRGEFEEQQLDRIPEITWDKPADPGKFIRI